jgi:hypothetical protein
MLKGILHHRYYQVKKCLIKSHGMRALFWFSYWYAKVPSFWCETQLDKVKYFLGAFLLEN